MKTEEEQWLDRIQLCVEAIREWEDLTSAGDGTPQTGSRIARDDERSAGYHSSTMMWSSIVIAVDHLGLADDALSREGGARLRPHAFYSLCRAALVAASQAIWLQIGNRSQRLRKLGLLEIEELKGRKSFLDDYRHDPDLAEDLGQAAADTLHGMREQVTGRLRTLKKELSPGRYEYSVTGTLKDAASLIAERRPGDPWLQRAYMAEWRLASGTAHARLWQSDMRPHEVVPLIGQSAHLRISTGTMQSYGSSLASAVMATSTALELWEEHSAPAGEAE